MMANYFKFDIEYFWSKFESVLHIFYNKVNSIIVNGLLNVFDCSIKIQTIFGLRI